MWQKRLQKCLQTARLGAWGLILDATGWYHLASDEWWWGVPSMLAPNSEPPSSFGGKKWRPILCDSQSHDATMESGELNEPSLWISMDVCGIRLPKKNENMKDEIDWNWLFDWPFPTFWFMVITPVTAVSHARFTKQNDLSQFEAATLKTFSHSTLGSISHWTLGAFCPNPVVPAVRKYQDKSCQGFQSQRMMWNHTASWNVARSSTIQLVEARPFIDELQYTILVFLHWCLCLQTLLNGNSALPFRQITHRNLYHLFDLPIWEIHGNSMASAWCSCHNTQYVRPKLPHTHTHIYIYI